MRATSVHDFVEELSELITSLPDGLPGPMLHLLDEAGNMSPIGLMPGVNSLISPVARLVVAKYDPLVAVIAVEAAMATTRPTVKEEDDPDKKRLLRGEVSVSSLPEEKRQQMLIIYGEDRAGNEAERMWITTLPVVPGWPRRYKPFEYEKAEELYSRVRPLYMFREIMADRKVGEHQARKIAREQATKELAKMGMIPQELTPPSFPRRPEPRMH